MDSLARVRISSARLSIWPGRRLCAGGEVADTAFDTLRATAATMSAEVSVVPEIQSSFWSSSTRGAGGAFAFRLAAFTPIFCSVAGSEDATSRAAILRGTGVRIHPTVGAQLARFTA